MAQKPSIPKGTRDFGPDEMIKRTYIFDTIKSVFRTYGFLPLETPAMENLSTLLGKYGDEGDKLLFKILNSGDFLSGVAPETLQDADANRNALSVKMCEKGLRYDLTVPFARYVVQHQNEISFPFRRYQIQPVLGIRGEDIKMDAQNMEINGENRLHAVITDTEVMGNENNLYFTFGGTQAVARVSKYEISQIGDRIDFVFMPSKMHFFDKETGVNYMEMQ